ncbi:MAG: hypothetical protein CM1200mP16_15520 [Nitrospina sp.]|nr:MAG: hypothetical protein CM1200mP16_15520 [Nitrospina sp.]
MEMWARDGVLPPPNLFPLRKNGTLLTGEEWREKIPQNTWHNDTQWTGKKYRCWISGNFSKGL